MEDALVRRGMLDSDIDNISLNPCFNGRCTRTWRNYSQILSRSWVLILVLMEDALVRATDFRHVLEQLMVLILVLMEDALVQKRSST